MWHVTFTLDRVEAGRKKIVLIPFFYRLLVVPQISSGIIIIFKFDCRQMYERVSVYV